MKTCALVVVLLASACGDDASTSGDAPKSDSGLDARPGEDVVPQCVRITKPAHGFQHGSDFSAADPGTLAGWDPNGRWFLTGVSLGDVSSVFFQKIDQSVMVDRTNLGSIDDTEIFERDTGQDYISAIRVSNLRADGSARFERARCEGTACNVCTAKLIRATHNNNEGEGDHISFVSELRNADWGPGYTFNVRVMGTLAYLIRQDGLHIIETADAAHPVEVGHYARAAEGYSNDVKLVQAGAKRYAILADLPVDIVDVTDPAHPALATQITEQSHTVAVETRNGKTLAYFGNYDAKCPVYDITNPAAPVKLGSYTTHGSLVHDLSIVDGTAYLNAWDAGFLVVDYSTPASPQLVGSWPITPTRTSHSNWTGTAGGRHYALHGEEHYGAKLDVVDIDPASATFMKSFATWGTRDYVSIHNLMVFGTKAYMTYYQDGIRVLDMSDPAHPAQVGYYNTWDPQADYTSSDFFESAVGIDVDLSRKLIFVADSPRGLIILHDDTPGT